MITEDNKSMSTSLLESENVDIASQPTEGTLMRERINNFIDRLSYFVDSHTTIKPIY